MVSYITFGHAIKQGIFSLPKMDNLQSPNLGTEIRLSGLN